MCLQFLRVGIPASVISDMDAPMRSLGGPTVPDGAVGILPAFMMVVAGCHNVDFCLGNAHLLSSYGSR